MSPLVQHCPGLLYPDMAYGHILAAYWSPDSSRLLTYNDCSCAPWRSGACSGSLLLLLRY